jgi:putative transposase
MPRGLERRQGDGDLHFVTFSCFRRLQKLGDGAARDVFVRVLEKGRRRWGFRVAGFVVMPEHAHLLVSEPEGGSLERALQVVKQSSSRRLGLGGGEPFWMARYYDFNVWSGVKVEEKLGYMHLNPVKRGLVDREIDWEWSSAGFYAGMGSGVVGVEDWGLGF